MGRQPEHEQRRHRIIGITSLSTDGTNIYGTGYAFGTGGNFEGTFSADPTPAPSTTSTTATATPTMPSPAGEVLRRQPRTRLQRWSARSPQKDQCAHHALRVLRHTPTTKRTSGRRLRLELQRRGRLPACSGSRPCRSRLATRDRTRPAWTTSRATATTSCSAGVPLGERRSPQQGLVRFACAVDGTERAWSRSPRVGPAQPHCRGVGRRTGPRHLAVRLRHGQRGVDRRRLPLRGTARPGIHDDGGLHLLELPDDSSSTDTDVPPGLYTYTVRASDPLGNTNTFPATAEVSVASGP